MKLNRLVGVGVLVGLVTFGAWLLVQVTSLTPESDATRNVQADRFNLEGEARTVFLEENELLEESEALMRLSDYFYDRYLYPTYQFQSAWLVEARQQDAQIQDAMPAGNIPAQRNGQPLNLAGDGFTPLGPNPLDTGAEAFQGRINIVVINPVDPTVAYIGSDGGGVWKTTNCCSAATSWVNVTDQDDLQGIAVGDITLDPNNPNVVYAGTGDLRYGSFSFGASGLLKSADAGATWELLGEDVFFPFYQDAPNFPQYNAIGKVKVNPNDSNQIAVGTKKGVHFSYDGGQTWTEACLINSAGNQRQDITAMLTRDQDTTTDLIVAVGTRGTETEVQQNLNQNGANGIYRVMWPASGCPAAWTLISTPGNGWPVGTGSGINNEQPGGNILGRIDMAISVSNPDVMYAEVQAVVTQTHALLGVWRTTDYGATWEQRATTTVLRNCNGTGGAPNAVQNWYNQNVAIDPNNPDIVWIQSTDSHRSLDGGLTFGNVTCGYETGDTHVDQHGITFLPGSSTEMLIGNDGGMYYFSNANAPDKSDIVQVTLAANFDTSALEFYSGDITGNFATDINPGITGGMQDNGTAIYRWNGTPPSEVAWIPRLGGDGIYTVVEPEGGRIYMSSQNGNIVRYDGFTDPSGVSAEPTGGQWGGDQTRLSFLMPYTINKWGDCTDTDADGFGCENLIGGTYRVWETVDGALPASWYINSPDLTKGNVPPPGGLGARAFINQLTYAFDDDSIAIVGTNDANVQIGFGMGQGTANSATWVNVTDGNTVLPNRPVLDVSTGIGLPVVGYAAVGGFDQNTPATPGHVFKVTCGGTNCATFTWENKTGNLPNIPVDSIIINPNFPQQAFAGTDWGLYFTNDINAASPTWYRFPGLPHVMIWDMTIDSGYTTLVLFTRSRGAYVWPLPNEPIPEPTGTPTPTASPTVTNTPVATSTPTATEIPSTVTPTATETVVPPTPTATGTAVPTGSTLYLPLIRRAE